MSQNPLASESTSTKSAAVRLGMMMLFQYAVWGVWLPVLGNYLKPTPEQGGLGFTPGQMGWIFGLAASIGAITAPFIAGQVADRYLNAERALGLLLIIGGVINILLAQTHDYTQFLILSIAYSVVYMPTLSLSNSIAFQNLDDPETKFPPVRLFGTVGWIIASISFTKLWLTAESDIINTRRLADAFTVSGVISIVYALYAFFILPKTPPRKDGNPLAFVEAFSLLKKPAFLIVTLAALPIAMIHQCYFIHAGSYFEKGLGVAKENIGLVLAIGQGSEIFFLLILGIFIKNLGYKWVLVLGTLSYALRFGMFGMGLTNNLPIAAQALHGLCYGCFFAGSFLLVEKIAGESIRHSAQTVFGIIILGLGPIAAGLYNQYVLGRFITEQTTNYDAIWQIQAGIAAATMLALLLVFPKKPVKSVAT